MGSLNIKEYCIVKDEKAITGTKLEIINQICSIEFIEDMKIKYKIKGFQPYVREYGNSEFESPWTKKEMLKDIMQEIWGELPNHGYTIFFRN